tara:strand:- start:13091 stop:13513 length:423 start_codon:yes stop_codon:yes gene_type:complete
MAKKEKLSTYKKQELVDLIAGLQEVENLKSQVLAVVSHQNVTMINGLLKDVEEIAQPSVEFMKLANEMQQFDMETELDKVKEKEALPENAKLIKERKEQIDKVTELLSAEVDCKLHKIKQVDLPIDITPKQLTRIQLILE